jgi:hypothetical protein
MDTGLDRSVRNSKFEPPRPYRCLPFKINIKTGRFEAILQENRFYIGRSGEGTNLAPAEPVRAGNWGEIPTEPTDNMLW